MALGARGPGAQFRSLLEVSLYSFPSFVCAQLLSRVQLLVTPWIAVRQVSLSMGCFRQESWSRLPFLPPRDLPNSRIEPASPALAGRFFTMGPPGQPFPSFTTSQSPQSH